MQAVMQMVIERLPEIASSIAEPLAKTEKIVIIDNGNKDGSNSGASKVTGYVTDIISQLPETIEAMTGFNFMEAIKNKFDVANDKKEDTYTDMDSEDDIVM